MADERVVQISDMGQPRIAVEPPLSAMDTVDGFVARLGLRVTKPSGEVPALPTEPSRFAQIGTGVTQVMRGLALPEYLDVSLLAAICFGLAVVLFLPFVVTSTFPLSVKWLMLCGLALGVGTALLALAARLRQGEAHDRT